MNPALDSKYWNNRYVNNDFGWDLGGISPPLKDYLDQLKDKSLFILIPGAGNSYEAEYLVNKGFSNVFVCDFAKAPLDNLLERCPAIGKEHLLQADFFELNTGKEKHLPAFDLIIEQTFFCAIDPSLRKNYFKKVHQLLKPGGKLVGLLFNDPLNTDKPPFGGTPEEYKRYFQDLFKVNVFETAYNSVKPRAGRELFINLEKAQS
ncbi:MAG: methyltransferase protein [Bacteroidetes bacterium]|nr:methyltransferase protein [Bacteroidota bacterium]